MANRKQKIKKYKYEWQENAAVHPIYGVGPSGRSHHHNSDISNRNFILGARFQVQKVFFETAIPADISFQGNSNFLKAYYVDQLIKCKGCKRHFIYFAEEHKHRVEEVGKNFQAIPSHCYDCRVLHGKLKTAKQKFDLLLQQLKFADRSGRPHYSFSQEQWIDLGENFLFLLQHNRLSNSPSHKQLKLRMKNLSENRITLLSEISKKISELS